MATYTGGPGNNSYIGTPDPDDISGGDGNDTLSGAGGADTIFGGEDNDLINGDAGNDTLFGGTSNDELYGGDNDDLIYSGFNRDTVFGGDGNDTIFGENNGAGPDFLFGDAGDDDIYGGDGGDSITGGDGNDFAQGAGGTDEMYGGTGSDTLQGDSGSDSLFGGDDDDLLQGGSGADTIFGGLGDDQIEGGPGSDELHGDDGADTISMGGGNDTVFGGDGDDLILDVTPAQPYAPGTPANGDFIANLNGWTPVKPTGGTGPVWTAVNGGAARLNSADEAAGGDGLQQAITTTPGVEYSLTVNASEGGGAVGAHTVLIEVIDSNDDIIASLTAVINDGQTLDLTLNYMATTALTTVRITNPTSTATISTDLLINGVSQTALIPTNDDVIQAGAGNDVVGAGEGNDQLFGEAGDDDLSGQQGNDTLTGGIGNDTLYGGDGIDSLYGGDDNDTLFGGDGNDGLYTGAGNDVAYGGLGDDLVGPDAGNDTHFGGDGRDTISGGIGNDELYGDEGNDTLFGDEDDDLLYGGVGEDTLFGGADNDQLFGGAENDLLDGEDGDDTLLGGAGDDELLGRGGNDSIEGGLGDDSLSGGDSEDILLGDVGEDTLFGGADNDTLDGGADNDILNGELGDDALLGGTGNDTLNGGGGGADTLTGGAGDDRFIISGSASDSIQIVNFGEGETAVGNGDDDNDFVDLTNWYNDTTLALYNSTYGTNFKTALNALQHDAEDGSLDFIAVLGGPSVTFNLVGSGAIDTEHTGVVCFARGTMIETDRGPVAIEELERGDRIETLDHGYQRIRWIGSRRIFAEELATNPKLRPIRISTGALGHGFPEADVLISRQHRVLVVSKIAERMFGTHQVLVPAGQLLQIEGIEVAEDVTYVEYFHFLFDRHQIVFAAGAPMESLFTGVEALKSISAEARREIFEILPELEAISATRLPEPIRPIYSGRSARKMAMRHVQNRQHLLGSSL
ncbi:Hint domain-containing protein [Szabonella alba]|uniref:Hint domain-containing protein n=1 Tax=Szabonella alba TaxID=2804194 RepID=A0A8K0VH48_9RHOB|nr:Hint domain-containing protein [Szabonella alba]MBL4919392.1 Hint domain-containing protein [Szabonella alba]